MNEYLRTTLPDQPHAAGLELFHRLRQIVHRHRQRVNAFTASFDRFADR